MNFGIIGLTATSFMYVMLIADVSVGKKVTINKDMTGEIGSNGTYIECLIGTDGVLRIIDVTILGIQNETMKNLIKYFDNVMPVLTQDGEHLRGRVTYNTINMTQKRAVLLFNQLLCEDDTVYQCKFTYTPDPIGDGNNVNDFSDENHLIVKVPPLKPTYLELLRRNNSQEQLDNSTDNTTPLTNQNDSRSEPSHKSDDNDNCFIKIMNEFINCSDVIVTCVGTVSSYGENLTVQMIENNNIITNLTIYMDASNNVIRENCTFIKTNSFATNLTRTTNKIKFRCVAPSLIDEKEMYLETEEVEFFYAVQTASIVIAPESAIYPPVSLYCLADGNPVPRYQWYKYENGDSKFIGSHQNISINRASDSGVYRCVANNTFGQQDAEKDITLKEHPTTTTKTTDAITTIPTSTPANPNTTPSADENKTDAKKLIPIIGGVVGGVVFIIIAAVIIIKCRHSSKPGNIQRRDDDLKMSSRKGVDNYYSMTLDEDNGKQRDSAEVQNQQEETRKHNERYLKQQELESNKREGDPQPVEYAAVNKPKKGRPYQNTDVHQPAEYAQVNKMRGNSNEPAPDYDDDPYASGKGIYDHAHDRRHKKTEDLESYDTAATVMNRKSGK